MQSRRGVIRAAVLVGFAATLLVEGLFLRSYLPSTREAVEKDGAVMLVLATVSLFGAVWLPTTRVKLRFFISGALLGCSALLFFLSYVLMTRW
jgi:hypothetical protein